MNLLICYYCQTGAHVLIIDIGNSYQGICALLKGYYFMYEEDKKMGFNPFLLPKGQRPDMEKLESLKTLMLALWKKDGDELLRSEYVALGNAFQLYYKKLGGRSRLRPCFNSFYVFLRDEFSLVVKRDGVKEKDFDLDNLLYVLRPFFQGGEYDYLLNATENMDLQEQRLIVFELDRIKDHPVLFPVITVMLMDIFIRKMRTLTGIRKVMVVEEAWKALARRGMSEYLRYLFKTIRKFYGEMIVVTQEADDILHNPIVKETIIKSTGCKILLDQSQLRNRFEALQQLLGLSEKDKSLVLSLNKHKDPSKKYKEVFIALGTEHSQVYRTEVSLEEYLTFTTEERERMMVQAFAKKEGSLQKGIKSLAAAIRNGSITLTLTGLLLMMAILSPGGASAQFPVAQIIEAGIKKVIIATDLAIQRIQTQTIGLQHAARQAENLMHVQELGEIRDWVQRQKDLYASYFAELWQVKRVLILYQRVGTIIKGEAQLVQDYRRAWAILQKDPHFSVAELEHMASLYAGIIRQGERDVGELWKVITGGLTQMEDADRLTIIDQLAEGVDRRRHDLRDFTQENVLLSLQRSKDLQDMNFIKSLYDIP